jgi:flagellar basal-body rod protein FlgF
MTDTTANVSASLAGLTARYEAIAHNLANSSTPAFKRHTVQFHQALARAGDPSSLSLVQDSDAIDFSQGTFEQTDRPLDFALDGKGFFMVETPKGPLYTRTGTFTLNANRQLVDSGGRIVSGQNGPIVLPPNCAAADVQITSEGELRFAGHSIGKLKIVNFDDPSVLTPIGAGNYRAPTTIDPMLSRATVRQGYQESSNVNTVQELVDLLQITRLYEANLKGITTTDDRIKSLLQVAMS